jgi:hypothetical protein
MRLDERSEATSEQRASMVFMMSLCGLFTCQVISPLAWWWAHQYMEACKAEGVQPSALGPAAYALGLCGTAVLMALAFFVAIYLLYMVATFAVTFGLMGLMILFMVVLVVVGEASAAAELGAMFF